MRHRKPFAPKRAATLWVVLAVLTFSPQGATAASGAEITKKSSAAIDVLAKNNLVAKKLLADAKGVLVFPEIVKAGFMLGGQVGEGALFEGGARTAYYNSVAASYGLQAGVQVFGYALVFMDNASLAEFKDSTGFEVGVGPSIVLVDEGVGKSLTTTTVDKGIYAFIFDQKGAMAGLGIQGSKITKIDK